MTGRRVSLERVAHLTGFKVMQYSGPADRPLRLLDISGTASMTGTPGTRVAVNGVVAHPVDEQTQVVTMGVGHQAVEHG